MNFAACSLSLREPVELVVEFRSRLRIAVRQIDAGDDDAVDGGFDIARFVVVGIAGQGGADQHRLGLARQDGDAVPGFLAAPHRAVAGLADRIDRKVGVGGFQFLQRDGIGFCRTQPAQQVRQAAIDVVDVEGGDFHARRLSGRYHGSRFRRGGRWSLRHRPCRSAHNAGRGWSALRSRSCRNGARVRRR